MESNLKPYEAGESRAIENGKKGGLKSGEARKKQKHLKQMLQIMLDSKAPPEEKAKLLREFNELESEDITYRALIIYKQMEKALAGDTKAAAFIAKISGEIPKEAEEEREVKLPIFNIEVVDNSHLKEVFYKMEEEEQEKNFKRT